jgi:group I intron endonuclease
VSEARYTIYCHTCLITGKPYVGQTVHTMEKRWRQHCRSKHGCRALYGAIREYGKKAWKHEVLEVVFTKDAANRSERSWIRRRNSLSPNGYNLTAGGSTNTTVSGETRQRIRESWTRRTPEQRAKVGRWVAPEARSVIARARWAEKTPEERSALAKRMAAAKTPERRSNAVRTRWVNTTKEERRAIIRAQRASMTEEQRAAIVASMLAGAKAKRATETAEQRSDRVRKAWETRKKDGHGGDGARKAWETRKRNGSETPERVNERMRGLYEARDRAIAARSPEELKRLGDGARAF